MRGYPPTQYRFIIVDDQLTPAMSVKRMIGDVFPNASVCEPFSRGNKAAEFYQTPYDGSTIVITDNEMETISAGLDLATRIREIERDEQRKPALVVMFSVSDVRDEDIARSGIDQVVKKPNFVDLRLTLQRIVPEYLENSRTSRYAVPA